MVLWAVDGSGWQWGLKETFVFWPLTTKGGRSGLRDFVIAG